MRIWITFLVVASMSLAGCMDVGGRGSDAGDGLTAADLLWDYGHFESNGNVVEHDFYVTDDHEYSPYEGRTLTGFAFGTEPDGSDSSIPGPEIRLTQGDTLRVNLHVSAESVQPHTIHWHGITLPWAMDGVPMMTQDLALGEDNVYTYEWVAREPGTYWYHCHVEAPAHIDLGMFGALIVEPADRSDDLPYDREEVVILHETDSRTAEYFNVVFGGGEPMQSGSEHPMHTGERVEKNAEMMADIAGFVAQDATGQPNYVAGSDREYYPYESIRYRPHYDTFMINGKSYPDTDPLLIKDGETLRVRIINAGTQPHAMHLHGHHFLVTHKDGYPLPSPYAGDTLLLGSGERYDIYVVGNNPGIWDFHDHGGGYDQGGFASNAYAFPGGMSTALVYEDFQYAQLPQPETGTAGDYLAFAPSYAGPQRPPDLWRSE